MSAELITRDDAKLIVAFNTKAAAMREMALEAAALIGKVSNPDENSAAVEAQKSIKAVQDEIDKAVDSLISQANDYKKRVWKARDDFKAELDSEMLRVSTMLGDFAALEQAKARAAEKLKQEELTRLERERAVEEANAPSHEALDAIQEHYSNKAAEVAERMPSPQPARAAGQVVKNDWEIISVDVHELYRHHPWAVKMEPRPSEIKAMLNNGVSVHGVTAKPKVISTVRKTKEKEAIAV